MAKRKKLTHQRKYLLLDVNDVTNVCGRINTSELRRCIKPKPIARWLYQDGILKGKWYVVEDF